MQGEEKGEGRDRNEFCRNKTSQWERSDGKIWKAVLWIIGVVPLTWRRANVVQRI